MELQLINGLEHQQIAVDNIAAVFAGVAWGAHENWQNPALMDERGVIEHNLRILQNAGVNNIPLEYRNKSASSAKSAGDKNTDPLNLDIKMETGTGKTYVYTKMMHELHKRYGVSKFVLVVPTLAIKAGARQFLSAGYVRAHFAHDYAGGVELCEVKPQGAKKGSRKLYPQAVREFVEGNAPNKIYVLLLNMQLLTNAKVLTADDYDRELFGIAGSACPAEAVRAARPWVVIDEPHRFARDQKAYRAIVERFAPPCVIRFGATFPEVTEGRGKAKTVRKDYRNLIYNLNACQALNLGLIKSVAKEHFEAPGKAGAKVRIAAIEPKKSVRVERISAEGRRTVTLGAGAEAGAFALVDPEMRGLFVEEIGAVSVVLSNGLEKRKGDELTVDAYASSYQEGMLRLAVRRHFETERRNFARNPRIKTLALFFINDIVSYRGDKENEESAWLKEMFERILRERLDAELKDAEGDYRDWLGASVADLDACHAGYFAQDNSDSDEGIAKEVDEILRGKAELLSFRHADGSWNTRRFLFSKWTLKEGWDNPNVFTIAKLRSSGSENSKLQEIGRGLRLPVDETGNRIGNEEFKLNYIVDFTEADFADRLVAEINGEAGGGASDALVLSVEQIDAVAAQRGMTSGKALLIQLDAKDYVDLMTRTVNAAKADDFYAEYPEFRPEGGVQRHKVLDRNKGRTDKVRVRAARFDELKDLWAKLNRKYVIFFDGALDEAIGKALEADLLDGVFAAQTLTSVRTEVTAADGVAAAQRTAGVMETQNGKPMSYNEFLRRANRATSIPVRTLHRAIRARAAADKGFPAAGFNESSLARLTANFEAWKTGRLLGNVRYRKADYESADTKLTDARGRMLPEVVQADIGEMIDGRARPSEKYLYEKVAYDSELERTNILRDDVEEVVVFGKIPRRSIAIPTIDGTYSPDFMYVVRRADGGRELNVVIETKGVENDGQLRETEKARIACAEKFFQQLRDDGVAVRFEKQINNRGIRQILEELME